MEPFRPIVDDFILTNGLNEQEFFKQKLKRLYEVRIVIENKLQYLPNAVKLFTRGVIAYMNQESETIPWIGEYDLKINEL